MGTQIACFNLSQINALSKSLGEYMKGSDITRLLMQCGIQDTSGESTKWERLEHTFISRQNNDRAPNAILRFVEEALQPVKFTDNQSTYEAFLTATNNVLIMAGVEMGKDGKLRITTKAVTIDEVKRRTDSLRQKLSQRGIHSTVLKYCREELLKENYFHAVLEAAKSLSDRVREITGLTEDGTSLFNKAFACGDPWIAMNRLSTDTERNQQNGLKEMLNGITHLVRNVTAHEVKIKWTVNEADAIDILAAISFLHRQLDQCFAIPKMK